MNRQPLRRPVDGCGGSPISCLARHVSRKIFSFACGMGEELRGTFLFLCFSAGVSNNQTNSLEVSMGSIALFLLSIPWLSFILGVGGALLFV